MPERYRDFNTHLRALFGCRVQKISVDAGLTCPNRDGRVGTGGCIYCNARGSGTGAHGRGLSVTEQLEQGKAALARRYKARKFLAYFQSFCNTYAPLETLQRLYAEALNVPDILGLAIGTRPDCVDAPVLDLLQELARSRLIWVEYGLQSAHDITLARINRGHTFDQFQAAVAATRRRGGIRICTHVILGLPGETRRQMLATAETVAALGIDGIKLHLLYIIRNTPLERLYRAGRHSCLEQAAYVDLVCDFLERLPPEMVIQRLTGDPHPEELVAPRWSLKKSETLRMIQAALAQRDTWQGKRFQGKGAIRE
jgi:radical SAM protein (TIGR01212 family)